MPPAIPLVQIGNRVALFAPDLGLALARAPWLGRWRGARPEARPGLTPGLSWPLSSITGLGRLLRQAGQAYAFIAEEGYLPGGLKRRVLRYLFTGTAPVVTLQPPGGRGVGGEGATVTTGPTTDTLHQRGGR